MTGTEALVKGHRDLLLFVCGFCILAQAILMMYSDHVRAGMLKTMRDQGAVLRQVVNVMEAQDRAIKRLRQECDGAGSKVAYR